jgi:hypothetical protein
MATIQTLYDKDGNPVYLTTKVEAIADNDSTSLQQLLYEKVDKVTGKDLSENNFSDANVQTLASAEQTANKVTTFTNASDTTYPTTKLVDTRFAAYENISVIVDIVESYAALIAYDLQLKANAVIKVLVDETKDNKSTYYRWTKISGNIFNWVYVGDDPKTMINDNTISTTDVWSSSKTNEEINKLLPLIYAGL